MTESVKPYIVEGTGIAVGVNDGRSRMLNKIIERVMTRILRQAQLNGITDPVVIRNRLMLARQFVLDRYQADKN